MQQEPLECKDEREPQVSREREGRRVRLDIQALLDRLDHAVRQGQLDQPDPLDRLGQLDRLDRLERPDSRVQPDSQERQARTTLERQGQPDPLDAQGIRVLSESLDRPETHIQDPRVSQDQLDKLDRRV